MATILDKATAPVEPAVIEKKIGDFDFFRALRQLSEGLFFSSGVRSRRARMARSAPSMIFDSLRTPLVQGMLEGVNGQEANESKGEVDGVEQAEGPVVSDFAPGVAISEGHGR